MAQSTVTYIASITSGETSDDETMTTAGTLGAALLVFTLGLICYLPLLGSSPLAGTEGHRAITAHQMVESNEWLVPRMFGRIYLAKPPLHYWIIGLFEKISGRATPLVWRLPSALEGAALAAMLCLFGTRWFGRIGGLVAGISYLTLVTLWGEDRGADIDVTNSLAATFAACCILEIHFGRGTRRTAWAIGVALGTAGALMVKGPAGLTIILGALLWACFAYLRSGRGRELLRPATWLPLVVAIAAFVAWGVAAWWFIRVHHLARDLTGVQEGMQDIHPHDWTFKRAFEWFTLPLTLFVFSLPVSLALLLAFRDEVRGSDPARTRMMSALMASVLLAWGVCFVSGMHLPRYAFVTLPLLCPIAGGVASRVGQLRGRIADLILGIVIGTAYIFWGATLVLMVVVWKHRGTRVVDIPVALAATAVCAATVWPLLRRRDWRAAWGIAVLACLCSIPFGYQRQYDRIRRTCKPQGLWVRSITGSDAKLSTCMMVLDQPDLFYYSGLATKAFDGDMLDWRDIKPNSWVVLEEPELKWWTAHVPDRLGRVIPFVANQNKGYLVWYTSAGSD